MATFSEILKKRSPAAAFVILAFAGGIAINDSAMHTARAAAETVYHAQYKACLQDNALRQESNNRVIAFATQRSIERTFIRAAAQARLAGYKETHHRSDYRAYVTYTNLLTQIDRLHYGISPLINCKVAVPAP